MTASIIMSGCGGSKKDEAKQEHDAWINSLNDSIAAYKSHIETATKELDSIQSHIGGMIVNFQHVSNPRLVEGYYIYNGWANRYPLTSTGIVARITEDEGFEIIAALTGAHFNQIRIETAAGSATSAVVPHDQALNYRAGNLNTVCFYGNATDSIGMLISANKNEKITLEFLNGSKTGNFVIPADQKEMVAATWQLYEAQAASHRLEKEIPMYSRRIDACRKMLDQRSEKSDE